MTRYFSLCLRSKLSLIHQEVLEELEKVKSEWIPGEVEREDSKVVVTVLVEVVKVVGICLNVSEGEEGVGDDTADQAIHSRVPQLTCTRSKWVRQPDYNSTANALW